MSTNAWSGVALAGVAANGNLTQLYPADAAAGVTRPGTLGQQIRVTREGSLHSIQLKSDGINAGTLELWDVNGDDAGADVSAGTAITNAQLTALQARGLARLIFRQDYAAGVGSGVMNAAGVYRTFMRGLAARLVSTGAAELNLVVEGGYVYNTSLGG